LFGVGIGRAAIGERPIGQIVVDPVDLVVGRRKSQRIKSEKTSGGCEPASRSKALTWMVLPGIFWSQREQRLFGPARLAGNLGQISATALTSIPAES
jgi:hypothetical protein